MIRKILGAGMLCMALAAGASAQNRAVMMMDDGSGAPMMFTWSIPDLDVVKAPDFTLRDLETMTRLLDLSEAQRDVIAQLLAEYQEKLAAMPLDAPKQNARRRMRGPEGDDDSQNQRANEAQKAIRDELEKAGVDPALLDNDQLDLGVSVSMGMTDDGDGPKPDMNVSVSLGPAEGVHLPEETMSKLEDAAAQIAQRIEALEKGRLEEQMREMMAGGGGPGDRGGAGPGAEIEKKRQEIAALRARIAKYLQAKRRLRAETVNGIQPVLSEGQIARWPAVERRLLREKTLPQGRIAGESLDLVALLEELEIPTSGELASAVEAYEQSLDGLLKRRNTAMETLTTEIDTALDFGEVEGAVELQNKERRLRTAVRDANLSSARTIGSLLEGERRAAFDRLVQKNAFARVYSKTPADRAFEAVLDQDGIKKDVHEKIVALRDAYRAERAPVDGALERLVVRHEPRELLRDLAGVVENLDADLAATMVDERDPLPEAFERRLALDRRYMGMVYDLLPAAMVAKLPALPDVAQQAPIVVERALDPDN